MSSAFCVHECLTYHTLSVSALFITLSPHLSYITLVPPIFCLLAVFILSFKWEKHTLLCVLLISLHDIFFSFIYR